LLVGLTGCRPTTGRGTLAEGDLRARVPPGVAVPAETTAQQASVDVCNGRGPVRLRVRWRSFTHQGIGYVSSYAVDLEKGAAGLEVQLGPPRLEPSPDLPMVRVRLVVFCTWTPLWGDVRESEAYVSFDAGGRVHLLE